MTGLDYFNARYYDPVTEQFLSADVVQGNAQGTSPYMYVMGNPESWTDPTGQYYTDGAGDTYHQGASYYEGRDGTAYDLNTNQPYNGNGYSNGWLSTQGPNATKQTRPTRPTKPTKPTKKTHPSTSSGGGGCKGTSLLGLCVANVGLFAQGVGEVLAAAEVLIAALIGAFQSSGLLWLIGQAFQYVASDAILLMRNGIKNILGSLVGPPGKGFKVFLDFLQLASDVAADIVSVVGLIKNIGKVLKYSGGSLATKWGGVAKSAATYAAAGSAQHATTQLAIMSVANTLNGLFGFDFAVNDFEQFYRDALAPD